MLIFGNIWSGFHILNTIFRNGTMIKQNFFPPSLFAFTFGDERLDKLQIFAFVYLFTVGSSIAGTNLNI